MSDPQITERKLIPLGNRGLQMTSFDELYRFSQFVIEAGFAPYGFEKAQQVFLALQMGMEVGLPPMASIQNVAVINNRPSFYGDICIALIEASGELEDMKETWTGTEGMEDFTCTIEMKRRGRASYTVGRWSLKDTKHAKLERIGPKGPSPHIVYPRDMMWWRAWHRAASKGFADILRGVRPREIVQEDAERGFGFDNARPAKVFPPVLPTKESLRRPGDVPPGATGTPQDPRYAKPTNVPNNRSRSAAPAPTSHVALESAASDGPSQDDEPRETVTPDPNGRSQTDNKPNMASASAPVDDRATPSAEEADYVDEGNDPEEIGYWYWVRKRLVELQTTENQFMVLLRKKGIASAKQKNIDQIPEEVIKQMIIRWESIVLAIEEEKESQAV